MSLTPFVATFGNTSHDPHIACLQFCRGAAVQRWRALHFTERDFTEIDVFKLIGLVSESKTSRTSGTRHTDRTNTSEIPKNQSRVKKFVQFLVNPHYLDILLPPYFYPGWLFFSFFSESCFRIWETASLYHGSRCRIVCYGNVEFFQVISRTDINVISD